MTVPPNPPPRPSDESPQHHDPATHEHDSVRDTTPKISGPATADTPISAPAPEHAHPATLTPAPASSYLSGIVTAGLAAICGAIFTSWAGVQGTLIGAMVGATIGSTVSEVVRAPLDALERRIIAAGVSARRLRQDGVVKTVMTSPTAAQQAFSMLSRGALLSVGATAIVGFLLAIGGVTAVESASGQPLAATLGGHDDETGTTIGNALPNPPAALAPAPSSQATARGDVGTVAGRSGGGMTAYPPTIPPREAGPSGVASSPTPAMELVPAASPSPEPDLLGRPAPPSESPSPDAALAEAANATPGSGSSALDGSQTPTDATGSPAAQVVTVVVTATSTSTPTTAASASSAAQTPTATATSSATPTPTLTPTRTPTAPPGASTPSGSPASPPPPPQT